MQGSPRHAVNRHHGFALVGDTDGGDRFTELCTHRLQRGAHGLPDFFRIVFDPTRLWIVLRELAIVGD